MVKQKSDGEVINEEISAWDETLEVSDIPTKTLARRGYDNGIRLLNRGVILHSISTLFSCGVVYQIRSQDLQTIFFISTAIFIDKLKACLTTAITKVHSKSVHGPTRPMQVTIRNFISA